MVYTAGDAAGVVEGHDLEAGVHRHRKVREVLGILLLEKHRRAKAPQGGSRSFGGLQGSRPV